MNEVFEYRNNKVLKKAWNEIMVSSQKAHSSPLECINLARNFLIAIHDYHNSINKELGGENFGKCVDEFHTLPTKEIPYNDALRLKQITEGFLGYSLYAARINNKRHSQILNASANRYHVRRNELQSWHSTLKTCLPLIYYPLKYKKEAQVKFIHELPDDPDYSYPSLLIDSSEDYFIEVMLSFMHFLSEYVSLTITTSEEQRIIKELLNKAKELLYDRDRTLLEKYQEMAYLCVYFENPSQKLNNIIASFVSKIPPGLAGFNDVELHDRKNFLNRRLKETKNLYHKYSFYLPSKVASYASDQAFDAETSIEQKIDELPFFEVAKDLVICISEDYFISATFDFIAELCRYVIRWPEANVMHDRHHVINLLLKKANLFLFDRDTPSLERFRDLAAFAIQHDQSEKGELHKIIQDFVSKEASLSEYGRINVPVDKRQNFVEKKLSMHRNYYRFADYIPSNVSNNQLEVHLTKIPHVVIKHLDNNCQVDPPPIWKFANWFLSILIRDHSLIKKLHQKNLLQKTLAFPVESDNPLQLAK